MYCSVHAQKRWPAVRHHPTSLQPGAAEQQPKVFRTVLRLALTKITAQHSVNHFKSWQT
jgi:hypothetical protein